MQNHAFSNQLWNQTLKWWRKSKVLSSVQTLSVEVSSITQAAMETISTITNARQFNRASKYDSGQRWLFHGVPTASHFSWTSFRSRVPDVTALALNIHHSFVRYTVSTVASLDRFIGIDSLASAGCYCDHNRFLCRRDLRLLYLLTAACFRSLAADPLSEAPP